MMNTTKNQFIPDYAIHPGEILEETLLARSIKKSEFAARCGLSDKTISQIIHEKAPVTPETAIQFERVLGISAAVWNNLEAFYRLHAAQVSSREQLKNRTEWVNNFPLKEIVARGIIKNPSGPVDAIEKLLQFFGVGSIEAFETRFKELRVTYRQSRSFGVAPKSVAVWLRVGELYAERIDTEPYDKTKFVSTLEAIRELTSMPPKTFEPEMKELCRKAGVALVFVAEFQGTHLSGATRWLNKDKALIMLSLRHKSDDHFWFSFFHEAAHVLLHGKKEMFLDGEDNDRENKEKEADNFSANFLTPATEYQDFVNKGQFKEATVTSFAKQLNIAPGIVVGRLQHDRHIQYSWFNKLKRQFELIECVSQ